MRKLLLILLCIFTFSSTYAIDKIGSKVKLSECYEYQESVRKFKKDKYPDYVSMQLYQVKNIFILEILKQDKSGILYILTDKDLERLKTTTPISKTESYYVDGGIYKEKITSSDIKRLERKCTEKVGLSISGYKKKFVSIQFDQKHKYIVKYTNFIKLF